jgi:uncharacterized membrane protein
MNDEELTKGPYPYGHFPKKSISSGDGDEISTKPICSYYKNIYKRMVVWFGYSYPFWLSDMKQEELLKCILNLNMKENMYLIFINVSIRIRINNGKDVDILNTYKNTHKNGEKILTKRTYYENNIDKIKEYNKSYHQMRKTISSINIFKKNN